VPYGPATPSRSLGSRFAGGIQLVGSLVGIPLALIGGYSTYHANFSPEAKCQALRGNIIAMLDKKADASTLRMLVHRDVVTFERDCGGVDAEAATAFKTLLVAEKTPALRGTTEARVRHEAPPKVEKAERVEKPAKPAVVEKSVAKADTKPEPKTETKSEVAAKPEPASKAVVAAPKAEPKPAPEKAVEAVAEKPVEEPKPVAVAAVHPDTAGIDAAWVASVRDALRESASQPAAEDAAPALAAPINITPEAQAASNGTPERRGDLVPPADIPPAPRSFAPRPPGLIPNAN
jgi:hypothetical protein